MSSVVIVSGCPGSGKTTLCRPLASADTNGLHLVSDAFYEWIAHPIHPTKPESRQQNTVIMHALASSVQAFAKGGYTVYLDGIFGPWFLYLFRPYLEPHTPTHYVVLQAPEVEALVRVRGRQGSGLSPTVTHMHRSLADLGKLARYSVETGGRSESEVQAVVSERLASDALALDWSLVPAGP